MHTQINTLLVFAICIENASCQYSDKFRATTRLVAKDAGRYIPARIKTPPACALFLDYFVGKMTGGSRGIVLELHTGSKSSIKMLQVANKIHIYVPGHPVTCSTVTGLKDLLYEDGTVIREWFDTNASFLKGFQYYRDTDLRAMSYEGIEITVKTILDDDRDHVAYVNSPMADGVDLTNVMAIQLMPRGFLRNTDRYEKHIVKAIDAVLVHLQVRDRITDQDIQDLVFNWEYARVVVKLLGVDS